MIHWYLLGTSCVALLTAAALAWRKRVNARKRVKAMVEEFMRDVTLRLSKGAKVSDVDWARIRVHEEQMIEHAQHLERIIATPLWMFRLQQFANQYRWKGSRIKHPPGASLRMIAQFAYSKKTFLRVFKPLLDDLEFEYIEALGDGRSVTAKWIYWRGVLAFWSTVVVYNSTSIVVRAAGIIKLIVGG